MLSAASLAARKRLPLSYELNKLQKGKFLKVIQGEILPSIYSGCYTGDRNEFSLFQQIGQS
jgi:hypothetical protein